MNMGKLFLLCLAGVVVLGCTSSCKSGTTYQDERTGRAIVERFCARKNQEICPNQSLTLQDCLAAAVTKSLMKRFREEAAKKADPQAAVEILEMLPSLRFQDGLSVRSDAPLLTIRRPNFYNIDLMIGLLDFGLGYWNTPEFLSETSFREQLMRKIVNQIRFETAKAYCHATSYASIRKELENVEDIQISKWKNGNALFTAKLVRKRGELEKSLHKSEEAYKNACTRLRTLMGLLPDSSDLFFNASAGKLPSGMKLPALEVMEQIALTRRPELYMGDIRKNITLFNCYGAIRKIHPELPGAEKCSISDNCRLGTSALYDLLGAPDKYAGKGGKAQARLLAIHSYSRALAVMAQVRLAHNEYENALELWKKAKQAAADCGNLLKKSRKGTLEYDDMLLDTIQAKYQLELAAMRCRIAENRILYALGITKLDKRLADTVEEEFADAGKAAEKDLQKAKDRYNDEINAIRAEQKEKRRQEMLEEEKQNEALLRKKTNEEIDEKYGPERNPAFWNKMGK